MAEEEEKRTKNGNAYHRNLEPGKEQRIPQWNLILVSEIAVGVDFYHTDMLEKVIMIEKVREPARLEEEEVKE